MKDQKTILFFDCETTGFGSSARLVQLAWIIQDLEGKELKSENYIIKPDGFDIPYETTEIHGITTEHALDVGEDLQEVLWKFMDGINNCNLIVGHNVTFDVRMVGYELMRLGIYDNLDQIEKLCTMHKSTSYCAIYTSKKGTFKKPKLQELHQKLFMEKFENAHNAMADVQATVRCYHKLKELGVINPIIA